MGKSAIRSVAWNAPMAGYKISEQTDQGTVATLVNGESDAWNGWLERVPSFAFHSRDGRHLTVVKEHRERRGAYWIAYRSIGGKPKKKYLGVPNRVTLARLEQVALTLTESEPRTSSTRSLPPQDLPATVERDQSRTPWQESLVATKFLVPAPLHALIARPRLTALLNQGSKQKLILVSAPAGFGKTTLVSTWVRSLPEDQARVAWVSLDEGDNDSVRFWTAVLSALDQCAPGRFHDVLALLHTSPTPALEYILTMLINRLPQTTTPWVLLLDDYHTISDPAVHAQLSFLLERQPPPLHLILLSRSDPPLNLARLRARGQILEVRTEQLRCTQEETRAFLTEVMEIEPPEVVLQEITARTEGWLAGLQLVGLLLQRTADPAEMLEEVRGSQRYILDYLVEEVLEQQSAPVQTFLLRTSILERLCAPLCDAVTGQTDSQQLLEELERANVFVVPLDGHRHWYRYHTLFAEALRSRLEQQQADEIDRLHVRASLWYAEQGNTHEAVQHALWAHAWQLAADLVERLHFSLSWSQGQGEALTLRQWLQELPTEVVRARPRLCLVYAQVLHGGAPFSTVESWLQAAEAALAASLPETISASAEHEDQQNLLGEIACFRALLTSYQGDTQAVLALCQHALSLFSPSNLHTRADVFLPQAVAYFAAGEARAAYRSALEGERLAQAAGNVPQAILYLRMAARSLMMCGHLHEAWRVLERAVRLAHEQGGVVLPRMDWTYVLQAEILCEWNRLDEALALATQAIQWGERLETPSALVIAYGMLAHLALSRGEPEATRAALERGELFRGKVDDPYELSYISSYFTTVTQVQLWLAQGDLARATHWAEEVLEHEESSPAFGREREEVALIRLHLAQDRPAEALTRLTPLVERATWQERWGHIIELRLLQARAQSMLHEEQEALARLSQALRLAEPEGYVRLFVDEGPLMQMLLSRLQERERKHGPTPYLDTLLAAFPSREQVAQYPWSQSQQGLLDPLSTRELEVLHQLARGASNLEIADTLVITVDTVKRHVGNILGKLQVSNRIQAVVHARTLGLLS